MCFFAPCRLSLEQLDLQRRCYAAITALDFDGLKRLLAKGVFSPRCIALLVQHANQEGIDILGCLSEAMRTHSVIRALNKGVAWLDAIHEVANPVVQPQETVAFFTRKRVVRINPVKINPE